MSTKLPDDVAEALRCALSAHEAGRHDEVLLLTSLAFMRAARERDAARRDPAEVWTPPRRA